MDEDSSSKQPQKAMSENEQVELVFLKFGLAESDEQLEVIVDKYLPLILEKVSSQDENIRTKVMQLLSHISSRLKSRPEVKLPVAKLLKLYKDGKSFVINFAIIYIKLGFARLTPTQQSGLAPQLFSVMEGKPKAHQDSLVRILVTTFLHIKLPENPEDKKCLFRFDDSPALSKHLLGFCMDVLLMPYSVSLVSAVEASPRPSTAPAGGERIPSSAVPPGLSIYSVKRLAGDSPEFSWSISQIEQLKVGILNMLGADLFPENEVVAHLIIASADTRHAVSTNADLELKKRQRSLDWSNPGLVSQLFRLYLGDVQMRGGSKKNVKSNPAMQRKPVSLRIKLKIVQNLLRSQSATERFPSTVQLVFDALFAEDTSQKLRTLGLEFLHHTCDRCDLAKLLPQAPLLLDAMLKTTTRFEGEPRTRGLAYTAMGKLSHRIPSLFSSNLKLVQDAFQALSQEQAQELKLYIQEALAMMSKAYSNVPVEHLPLVEAIISKYITDPDHLCRLAAVRYAGVVFAADHVSSRYLLLLAASDVKEDVATEAKKLLHGGDDKSQKQNILDADLKLPAFTDMLNYVSERAGQRLKSLKRFIVGTHSLAFAPSTFLVLIQYLRKCLLKDATRESSSTIIFTGDADSEAPVIAEYIERQRVEDAEGMTHIISNYLKLIIQFLSAVADSDAAYILLEMFAICSEDFPIKVLLAGSAPSQDSTQQAEHLRSVQRRVEWIRNLAQHTKESIREYGAELYSIIIKRLPQAEINQDKIISELLADANSDKNFEKKHGSILILGHLLGDWLHDEDQEMTSQTMKDALLCLVEHILSRDVMIASASCFSLSEIMRKTSLPLLDGQIPTDDDQKEKNDKEKLAVTKDLDKSGLLDVLLSHVKSSSAHKLREKSIVALGCFPVGDVMFPHTEYLLKCLLDSAEIKEADLHFTVGETLCSAALGPKSRTKLNRWKRKTEIENPAAEHRNPNKHTDKVSWLLQKILNEYVQHRIPAARQAACIWLLTIVKTEVMTTHPDVHTLLPDIQSAFMSFLAEADELIQDVASKGLGVVYELGSEEQKKQLVDGLVGSLLGGGATQAPKANQDNLFQGIKVGKAPDGSKLSTYKEICSLASDLNQPDLVYKFLHLAKHHALWNSKKGAAFGFSNIASLASEQLAPHLPRIVPRLYRYTFDPQPGVRSAMTSIWNALAPDPKKLVDQYLDQILQDLKTNLSSNTWRTRQASCLALAELLRGGRGAAGGEDTEVVISAMPDLWSATLRVMDDIKETVRDAATAASKSLKKITVKLCDHDQGKRGEKAVSSILPCLMKEGLTSRVKEVKSLSLSTLVEVSKKSGNLIRGCIPEMVVALLEALSEFEPPALNYLAVRSDKEGRELLDLARAEAARSSPMVETIDRCLKYADKSTLETLVPSATELVSKNVGVMTKSGCSHVFISLVSLCPTDLTLFASSILTSLLSGLTDSSLAIRKCNSEAIGHVVKVAKVANVSKVFVRLKSWYLEKEDEVYRHASAAGCHAIGKRSPDVLRAHASIALPLAFLGMHECESRKDGKRDDPTALTAGSKKEDKNSPRFLWNDLWTEFTPGTASAIKLYLDELIDFTSVALQSSQWKMKAQAAAAMATVARQQREGTIAGTQLRKLLEVLLNGLQGRTWDGKEQLLTALCAITVHCKSELTVQEVTSVLTTLFKECKREKVLYKAEAIHSLGSVLETHKIDKFASFWDVIHPVLRRNPQSESDSNEEVNEIKNQANKPRMRLLENSIHACGKAWPNEIRTQEAHFTEVVKTLAEHATLSTWTTQVTALQAAKLIFKVTLSSGAAKSNTNTETNLQGTESSACGSAFHLEETKILEAICASLGNAKYSRIREEGLALCQLIHDLFKAKTFKRQKCDELVKALRLSPLAEKKSSKKAQVDDLIKKLTVLEET